MKRAAAVVVVAVALLAAVPAGPATAPALPTP